jgi:hypothetical protein
MKLMRLSSGVIINLDQIAVINPPRHDGAIVMKLASGNSETLSRTTLADFNAICAANKLEPLPEPAIDKPVETEPITEPEAVKSPPADWEPVRTARDAHDHREAVGRKAAETAKA